MYITPIFSSFFAELNIADQIDNNAIKKYCSSIEKNGQVPLDTDCQELLPLTNWTIEQANSIKEIQGIDESVKIKLDNCWINNSIDATNTHSNFPHTHINYWISFVYYVSAEPNCGSLILMPPHLNIETSLPRAFISSPNLYNAARWTVVPKESLAVVFSSWLTHYVEPNHSNSPRISIAYNFSLPHQNHLITD